ncbi:ATP-dependent DNA helicase RecG [Aggregatibacter actinomycetemcomitans serotype e str. SC1083]|uniref:ATP-dependent DNA helicase RecG n=1 Tax=Aggregatibacter actinomycetemcomitans serotype e str. SC1083 TaxID=907488 RepID=G4A6M1_AGGAC|nr:ATP-dependent DNA helicase RecG [Aggregatibacter actinomycetemcomitans]EGY34758.1 ATP-dependent DNA helicase RecG [Aggregatibacter actinomycetemcomitans serotype e str. SC1083]KYK76008.1 ATP-dependent DNA helicase RecG [Aggregatibacter actinomycetemcomitans serotype e str. SA3096]KYK81773.1 ATP-dependent DNA helicase RecG [Aggregatibacter actinomycetemcomitans serotype e str. SC936]KYK94109.1 ATP-dependent DNA helicase RecG [Aggregatibacter actinomycetemcomitans serotype e str. ANH9776]TYB2
MSSQLLDAIPLTAISGVGAAVAEKLGKLGIFNLQDLLFHLPLRYEDRTRITPIADLQAEHYATIEGIVQSSEVQFGRRPMLMVYLSDGTSKLALRFFNFNAGMKNSLQPGARVKAFGEVRRGRFMAEIHHPEYQIIHDNKPLVLAETLTPIYPATEGLKQTALRKLIAQALLVLDKTPLAELLPTECNPHPFDLKSAIQFLHNPPPDVSLSTLEEGKHPAQQRLIFEELLAYNLAMQKVRSGIQANFAEPLHYQSDLKQRFLAQLPFQPTNAQLRVTEDIERDVAQSYPMMRLVQGDVGSGKTLVAALAALLAIDNGKQVALMAPTEILAEQHAVNFRRWFEPLGIQVGWLAGKVKGKQRVAELEKIKSGAVQMVVGTHALFQEEVEFHRLSLVIVDEQHRFGVHQRLMLREKGNQAGVYPHQLIMTATPIPRTLAMTVYADLDTSIIDELPPGRTPITTIAISEDRRADIIERVNVACTQEKRQAYWVCTLIDESEVLEAQAAEAVAEDLRKILPHLRIGLVHGRMKPNEKQAVMAQFKLAELDLLVATTVIEVGVDVPNASLMIIENAERLGLSQLHQLRGRVGRGSTASFCVLMYKPPLGKISQKRLQVMRDTQDGFVISEKDLEIRGPGEVLGTKQTGITEFKVANLMRDRKMLPTVQFYAKQLIEKYPQMADLLIRRWLNNREIYSNA